VNRIYHFLAWLGLLLLYVVEDFVEGDPDLHGLLLSLSHAMALATSFYVFYPRVWEIVVGRKIWWIIIPALPIGIGAFIGSRLLLQEVLIKAVTGMGNYNDPWHWGYVTDNVYRPVPIILISLVVWLVRRQNELKAKENKLAKEKSEAELSFLRGQINPHFLFNNLGFIQSRVYRADPEASEMILELSGILRKAFDDVESETIPLKEEIGLIKDLHGIAKKRFGGQCFIRYDLDEGLDDMQIEPLILMSLAENMLKHGDLREPENPGIIEGKKLGSEVVIRFQNKIMKGSPPKGSGIGLKNTRRRLELVYGNGFRLDRHQKDDYFIAELTLPAP